MVTVWDLVDGSVRTEIDPAAAGTRNLGLGPSGSTGERVQPVVRLDA